MTYVIYVSIAARLCGVVGFLVSSNKFGSLGTSAKLDPEALAFGPSSPGCLQCCLDAISIGGQLDATVAATQCKNELL